MYHQSQKTKLRSIPLTMSFLAFLCVSTVRAQPWEQTYKLLALDGGTNDHLGESVAISGDIVVAGASENDNFHGSGAGAAYIFNITTGSQLFKLLAADGAGRDDFGSSVASDGNLAVIGAPGFSLGSGLGAVYVFDVSTGEQIFKLLASDGAGNDQFGYSVAMSGNLAVIGARFNDGVANSSGAAYVFDVNTGQQLNKLVASDGTDFDNFGTSVSISGNIAVIGAPGDSATGSAYVFDVTTGTQLFKLLADDGEPSDNFGISVAVSDNLAVIGASKGDGKVPNTGSAYVFDVTTGQQLYKLFATDGEVNDIFGYSVAINNDLALVGAIAGNGEFVKSGSAYVFELTTGQQSFKLFAADGDTNFYFGSSVAISGNIGVIGAMFDDNTNSDSGAAYVFQRRTTDLLTVSPAPLIAGQDGTFSMIQTLPNEQTWLIYSLDGLQQQFIRQLSVVIDLANPQIAVAPRFTDANGDLQFILPMPGIVNPLDVWFQAVQQRNVTNFVATQLIP